MSAENRISDEFNEFEALLPWYVAGTLDADEKQRMDDQLSSSAELRRLLDITLEEQEQSILTNEQRGLPSSAALPNLMTRLDGEPQLGARRRNLLNSFAVWVEGLTSSLSPFALGASAAAAAVIICLQAALLAGIYFNQTPQGAIYETASHGSGEVKTSGPRALIAFQPELKAAALGAFLAKHDLRIIDGPRPGGFYLLRMKPELSPDAARELIALMQKQTHIVHFAALSQ